MLNAKAARGKKFTLQLKSIRQSLNWTQADLACVAGVPTTLICHYERGHRSPSVETLVRLADALNVSVDLLLGRL